MAFIDAMNMIHPLKLCFLFTMRPLFIVRRSKHLLVPFLTCAALFSCRPTSLLYEGVLSPIKVVPDLPEKELDWHPFDSFPDWGDQRICSVYDSLAISYVGYSRSESFWNVSSWKSGTDFGDFVLRGRGPTELLSCSFFIDVYPFQGKTHALLYDFSSTSFFRWDVTSSLESGRTILEKESSLNRQIPLMSFFKTEEGEIVINDSGQNAFTEEMLSPPRVLLFDPVSMTIRDSIPVFRPVNYRCEDNPVVSKVIFNSSDCYHPSSHFLCMAMTCFPAIVFVNTQTKELSTIVIRGQPHSIARKGFRSFQSVSASDDRIYALYSGEKRRKEVACKATVLYEFSWDGDLLNKYRLKEDVQSISFDKASQRLFFFNPQLEKVWYRDMQ